MPDDDLTVDELIDPGELRRTAQRLAASLAKEKHRTAALVDAVYQAARDASIAAGKAIAAPVRDRRKGKPEVALLHTTDWQVGKVTESYSSEIAEERIARTLVSKVDRLAEIQRSDHPVRDCHVMLGGDMVEGVSIFPGQPFEVDATLYEQLFTTARITETLVRSLLACFERVTVWDIHGNHGRIGRRGDMPGADNVDRLMYRIVRDRLAGERRLAWHHAQSWHQIVEVGAYRALLVHGDQIRSFGGNLPAYGIVKKFAAWKSVLGGWHDGYVGHFHTDQELNLASGDRVYMTGSPESGNEYAREFVAATGRPSQRLHFIEPERGRVTARYRIELG